MRRIATVVLLLLLVLFGAYTALWFFIADRMADEIAQWAERERQHKLDVSWDKLRVGGYPLVFRIEASGLRVRDAMPGRAAEARAPLMEASAYPWNFQSWALALPAGLTASTGPAAAPRATLTAQTVSGEVVRGAERDIAITLDLEHPVVHARGADPGVNTGGVNTEGRVAAREAIVSASGPQEPPQTHTKPAFSLAVE